MSGTIRSRMEAQRDRHRHTSKRRCFCGQPWPCPDRVAADDTLTELNNAKIEKWWDNETEHNYANPIYYRLIPDPDSRGAA